MTSVDVIYKGKKSQLYLKMPWLSKEYQFRSGDSPVAVDSQDVDRLIRDNPRGFARAMVHTPPEVLDQLLSDNGADGEEIAVEKSEGEKVRPKYISQMTKPELAERAEEIGVVIDLSKTVTELREEVKEMAKNIEGVEN